MLASLLRATFVALVLAGPLASGHYTHVGASGDVAVEGDLAAAFWFTDQADAPDWTLYAASLDVQDVVGTVGFDVASVSYAGVGNSIRGTFQEATATPEQTQGWAYMEVHALPQGASWTAVEAVHEAEVHQLATRHTIGYVDGTQYSVDVVDTLAMRPMGAAKVEGDFFVTVYGWDLEVVYTGDRDKHYTSGEGEATLQPGEQTEVRLAPRQLEIYVHDGVLVVDGLDAAKALAYVRGVDLEVDGRTTLSGPDHEDVLDGHYEFALESVGKELALDVGVVGAVVPTEAEPEPVATEAEPTSEEPALEAATAPLTQTAWSLRGLVVAALAALAVAAVATAAVVGWPVQVGVVRVARWRDGRFHYDHGLRLMRRRSHKRAAKAFEVAARRMDGRHQQQAFYEAARAHARAGNPVGAAQWLVMAGTADPAFVARAAQDSAFENVQAHDRFRSVMAYLLGLTDPAGA